MSSKHGGNNDHDFRFSLQHLIRLGLFFAIIAFIINYLSSQSQQPVIDDPTVLGEETNLPRLDTNLKQISDNLIQTLPPESQEIIKNLDNNPVIINGRNTLDTFKSELNGFPQKQIKQFQKELIKQLYQNALESLGE